eukprot:855340-Amphidinium_carterae.3
MGTRFAILAELGLSHRSLPRPCTSRLLVAHKLQGFTGPQSDVDRRHLRGGNGIWHQHISLRRSRWRPRVGTRVLGLTHSEARPP